MAYAQWIYGRGKQPAVTVPPPLPATGKRPRLDYAMPTGHDMFTYHAHEDGRQYVNVTYQMPSGAIMPPYQARLEERRGLFVNPQYGISNYAHQGNRVTQPVNAPYDSYWQIGKSSFSTMGIGGDKPETSLPPDACNTLYVEGLPAECTQREVSHIFRPFVGYKELRLVTREPKRPEGRRVQLCFVEFMTPAHAAAAMDVLQGYKFDVHDSDSTHLRLQFCNRPLASSWASHCGNH